MIPPSTASKIHLPIIKKAIGKYCWTADGKKLLDFTGSNLTVILGHQRYNFGLSPNFPGVSILELEAIKTLRKYTKTRYFRFFKNGTDAVSCAIRLARHISNEDDIFYKGYAGSHNEYVYTFNENGIPEQHSEQITDSLCNGHVCGILHFESRLNNDNTSADIKICDHLKSGILGLYENIYADFHIYGKSIANGYPIAILTGRDDYMKRIDEIYYSTTYGGENTGLEAMLKTIKQFENHINEYCELHDYAKSILPQWTSLDKKQIKKFINEGILYNGYWQIMLCHTKHDIYRLKNAIDKLM